MSDTHRFPRKFDVQTSYTALELRSRANICCEQISSGNRYPTIVPLTEELFCLNRREWKYANWLMSNESLINEWE